MTDVERRNATTRGSFTFGLRQVSHKQNDLSPEVLYLILQFKKPGRVN